MKRQSVSGGIAIIKLERLDVGSRKYHIERKAWNDQHALIRKSDAAISPFTWETELPLEFRVYIDVCAMWHSWFPPECLM